MSEKTKERNQEIADLIKPVLLDLQILMREVPIEEMESILNRMKDTASTLAAWPFPNTLNKAEEMNVKNELFKAMINFMKAQKKVLDFKNKPKSFSNGDEVLKAMGLL